VLEYLKNDGYSLTLAKLGEWEDIQTIKGFYMLLDDELAEVQEKNSSLNPLLNP